MSGETKKQLLQKIESLAQFSREQQLKIARLEQDLARSEQKNAQQAADIEDKQKHIAKLIDLIDITEREKWSYQSELENLRGY